MVPAAVKLNKVAVCVGDLKSATGAMFTRAQVECAAVGYVATKTRPPYGTSHIGWIK
mgnify:FL=1